MSRQIPSHRERAGRHATVRLVENAPGDYSLSITGGSAGIVKMLEKAVKIGMSVISGVPANPKWEPLEPTTVDPRTVMDQDLAGEDQWMNDLYMVSRLEIGGGVTHLSIKRNDKTRVREWRHLQQIKNELCGPEREAVEIFPPESALVDQADQYHLWVMPEGFRLGLGWNERTVMSARDADRAGRKHGVVIDQSPWAEGLTTGESDG